MDKRPNWFGNDSIRPIALSGPDLADARKKLLASLEPAQYPRLYADVQGATDRGNFLAAVSSLSPYLGGLMINRAAMLETLYDRPIKDAVVQLAAPFAIVDQDKVRLSEAALMTALRKAKADVHLLVALADLAGDLSVAQVTQALADFAASCLRATLDWLLLSAHEGGKIVLTTPQTPSQDCGISVLAMGKFGANELNYSSDIDLILLYDPDVTGLEYSHNVSPGELISRMGRQLIKIMQERTGDGYVFRTDLRLRPDPGATPLAISYGFAINYYESRGQNWERAAMIKAAPVAGDHVIGRSFLKELTPFIWRRYLDFAAIADIKSIKRQIHAHRGHGVIAVEGHNVKLGRGGIREIEFFVQTQQLIAGGRDPSLRGLSTMAMLRQLAEKGWITPTAADELADAYVVLRRVEHAIQMIADEQSHTLPQDQAALTDIALLLGYEDLQAFRSNLVATMKTVEKHFGELFESEAELGSAGGNLSFTGDEADPSTISVLSGLGYQRPADMWSIIRTWHTGRYRALQWEKARERLTELTPFILSEFSKTGQPDATIVRFDALLERLPAGMQLFSLLQSNPQTLRLLATILAAAPAMADTIIKYPLIFDGLLDPAFVSAMPERDALEARLSAFLRDADLLEEILDRLRIFAAEQRFLISVRLLTGLSTPSQTGIAFSDLADTVVAAALKAVNEEMADRYGRIPGAQMAVLALGRLGSREMTTSSDLDLIVLYSTVDPDVISDGKKPLDAAQYYARFTQRLIAALSAPMAQGILYELDFRLRPSGNKGPLATTLSAFKSYQLTQARTWEHLALCRARVVCGDEKLVTDIEQTVAEILDSERPVATTRKAVAEMRLLLAKEKPGKNIFDVKRVDGGMTDIDFIAQFARLTTLRKLNLKPMSAHSILSMLDSDFISADEKETLNRAYEDYSAIIQMVRLCTDDGFDPQKAPLGMTQRILAYFDLPDIDVLTNHLEATQSAVAKISQRILGFTGTDS